MPLTIPEPKGHHDLDVTEIDDLDEIDEDQQLALVWCNTHRKHEWHWLDRAVASRRKWPARKPT